MARLNRSDDTGANREGPGRLSIPQGRFRTQQDVIGDSLLQLGGRGEVGTGVVNDPLNAPFVLYVNPYTGRDTFNFGSYSATDDDSVDQELRRIESQRLECGYTEARPFRTVNRAIIEAGLITSKSYFDNVGQDEQRVCIVLAPGVYTAMCAPGITAANQAAFNAANDTEPEDAFLRGFNPSANLAGAPPAGGGIILPRGCSMVSMDLRKTIIRPEEDALPAANVLTEGNLANGHYPNRRAIFRVTGEGYYYGFTFMDAMGVERTHHLLSCFEFATEPQLDEFYAKLNTCFNAVANWQNVGEWDSEGRIVGPQPAPGTQTEATDTTESASPYIYNCSVRSEWGLCGAFFNRQDVGGFGSVVMAQFTGVSLQRDLQCWQQFAGGAWGAIANYPGYISEDPDDLRMHPDRRSFHIRAANRCVIQEVSDFAIGQGVHHWVESGGSISITNSNSNFGGVAALAEGFQPDSFPQDSDHQLLRVRRASDLADKRNNIRRINIGTTDNTMTVNSTNAVLTVALTGDEDNRPDVLGDYSLQPGTLIWLESDNGADFFGELSNTAWDASANQNVIEIEGQWRRGVAAPNNNVPAADDEVRSRTVYIRRLIDTRSVEERTYSFICANAANLRVPVRDYVIGSEGGNSAAPNHCCVQDPGKGPEIGGQDTVEFKARQVMPPQSSRTGAINSIQINGWRRYNRPGDAARNGTGGKHFISIDEDFDRDATPDFTDADAWIENNVHTETDDANNHNPEDFFKNVAPVILFDYDLSALDDQTARIAANSPLNVTLRGANNVWTDASNANGNAAERLRWDVQAQYTTATDYRGCARTGMNFLAGQGFGSLAAAIATLAPVAEADVLLDVSAAGIGLDMHRPSDIRMFGHAFEWAGYANYTKALPQYQLELSKPNRFSYYGTSKDGGRVYFSGFNEEGFAVSNRGIEDIQTGEIELPEQPDGEGPACTFFGCLRVGNADDPALQVAGNTDLDGTLNVDGNTTLGGTLNVAGVATFPGNINLAENLGGDIINFDATTTRDGIGDIASAADLRSNRTPAGNDAAIDAALNAAGANFVTVDGLNYWRQQNGLVSAREGVTELYVGADSGGSNDTANAWPVEMPNTVNTPVTLARAVAWANANRSPFETVEYRLDTGIYNVANYTFNTQASVRGWNHSTDADLGTVQTGWYAAAGTTNNFAAPHFIQENLVSNVGGNIIYSCRSVTMTFNETSSVRGIVWWDADRSARFVSNGTHLTNNAKTVAEKAALGATANALICSTGNFCARYAKQLNAWNCIIGASNPRTNAAETGVAAPGCFDAISNDSSIKLYGIILRGNVGTTALAANNASESYAHSTSLVSAYERQVRFGLGIAQNQGLGTNITLQDNSGAVPVATNTRDTSGPFIGNVFGWNSGLIPFGQFQVWNNSFTDANQFPGWSGTFHDGTVGTLIDAPETHWSSQRYPTPWVVAGAGTVPIVAPTTNPGEVGPLTVFANLNVQVRYCNTGIDVNAVTRFENDVIM